MDLKKWYNGDKRWSQIRKENFGWLNTKTAGEAAGYLRGSSGKPGDRVQERIRVTHRDFKKEPPAAAAQISQARPGGMYKPGGISQALITGAITPEQLALLRYGAGSVAAQERNIALEDVGKIKTTLRSAV